MITSLALAAVIAATPEPPPQQYRTQWTLADAPARFRHPSPTTNTHETTHGLNSMLRQRYGGACFYIGGRRFLRVAMIRRPTLGRVAQQVQYRGAIAELYLERQRHPLTPQQTGPGMFLEGHEYDPLTLFDELNAYTNAAGIEDSNQSSLTFGLEMAHYAATLVATTPSTYQDRPELARIWCFFARRLDRLAATAKTTGRFFDRRQTGWHHQLARDYQRIAPIAKSQSPTTTTADTSQPRVYRAAAPRPSRPAGPAPST